jgi:arylsulfatase A-like enzyme
MGWVLVSSIVLCLIGLSQPYPRAADPNILVVLLDDVGVDVIGGYGLGTDPPPTPTLDRLRASGVLFRNAWVNPLCSPTRATIQTGRYAFRTGVGDVVGAEHHALPLAEWTIPEVLALYPQKGYRSAAMGKWHLGNDTNGGVLSPNQAGWEHYAGVLGNLLSYFYYPQIVNGVPTPLSGYATTIEVDNALAWLSQQDPSRPWLLYLAFHAPHQPWHKPPPQLHTYDLSGGCSPPLNCYRAALQAADTELGRLWNALAPEVRAQTLVIVMGDNGTPPQGTAPPFNPQHAKATLYEGGIHVPLIVSGYGVVNGGRESVALVQGVDLFTTVLDYAGADVGQALPGVTIDGKSLRPILEGTLSDETTFRAYAYSEYFSLNPIPYDMVGATARTLRYKLIEYEQHPWELYDLQTDPFETTNVLDSLLLPVEAAQAYQQLRAFIVQLRGY